MGRFRSNRWPLQRAVSATKYVGITDHSQSLKIARGVSIKDLWEQIRFIDKLNSRLQGIVVLKSAEVDILADGSLDYPDDLLKELDYTVCSVNSRFGFGKDQQTERRLRAMDNRYFNILGHPTGRLLLKRPGYELDIQRIVDHAKQKWMLFRDQFQPRSVGSVGGKRTTGQQGRTEDRGFNGCT